MNDEISYCNGCHCITKSIRKGRAKYKCGKCGHDKSISDIHWCAATKDEANYVKSEEINENYRRKCQLESTLKSIRDVNILLQEQENKQ